MNYTLALAFDGASGTSKYSEAKGIVGFLRKLFKPLLKMPEEKLKQAGVWLKPWESRLTEANSDTVKLYGKYLSRSQETARILLSLGERPRFYGPMMKAFSNMKDPVEKKVNEERVKEIRSFATFGNVTISKEQRAELMAYAHNSAVDVFMEKRDHMLELFDRPWDCEDLKSRAEKRECKKSPSFNEYMYKMESLKKSSANNETSKPEDSKKELSDKELKEELNKTWDYKRKYRAPEESDAPEKVKEDPEYQLSITDKDDKEKRNFLKKLIKDLKDSHDKKSAEKKKAKGFKSVHEFYSEYSVNDCDDIERWSIRRLCRKLEN
jgi:hypothetical protein